MTGLIADLASPLRDAAAALRQELAEIDITGPRGGQSARTTLAVVLAVIVALLLMGALAVGARRRWSR